MTDDQSASRIPVVIDEWIVVLWADSKIPAASAARLTAVVDAGLSSAAATLSAEVATEAWGGGIPARVEVAERRRR